MAVSITLIVPLLMSVTPPDSDLHGSRTDSDIPILSHAIAIVLAIIFVIYEHFRKWFLKDYLYSRSDQAATQEDHQSDRNDQPASHELHESVVFAGSTHILHLCATGCMLICTTLCAIICAFHLVGSVDGLAKALNISQKFISLVLIPPTGYSAKFVNIVAMARKNEMDSVMRTVLINILQIILFIIPFLILLGWIVNQPFILNFNIFEGIILFLTLVVITCTIQNGKANYFDGIMLIGT
jgi:Ca2+:H+ antiporter